MQKIGTCQYLGKQYPIMVMVTPDLDRPSLEFTGQAFEISCACLGSLDLEQVLEKYYKKQAKHFIEKRLKHFQPLVKTKYKSFSIESHQGKWGSCNTSRHLTFHWQLMVFQQEVIDYVVIHELCHLVHMNHDRSFWRLLGKLCPDYKAIMPILGTQKTRDL